MNKFRHLVKCQLLQIPETAQQQHTQQRTQPATQASQPTPQLAQMVSQEGVQVMTTAVSGGVGEIGTQQVALSALQASLNTGGHIILTGADAAQLGSKLILCHRILLFSNLEKESFCKHGGDQRKNVGTSHYFLFPLCFLPVQKNFYAPVSKDRGAYCFTVVCLSVCTNVMRKLNIHSLLLN